MRSIGKVKIRKLRALCREEFSRLRGGYENEQAILARVPAEWFDTWESAWSEIERIISDEVTRLFYHGGE